MTRPNRARAPEGASGTCRDRRRPQGERRRAWLRPFVRANRAITASARLITSTILCVSKAERSVRRRPVGASRSIHAATARLVDAGGRLTRAVRDIQRTADCLVLDPERPDDLPELIVEATESVVWLMEWLGEVADDVFARHAAVLGGLESGALVPERPADRRPRIRLAPRPTPIRDFLQARQPRVIDRIASILRRRRRTPRPAALRVPRRSILGRAPPLSPSACSDHLHRPRERKEGFS